MIAHYAQAGLVSELKRLAAPASVDSIPTSAMQEDHVSMGWHAARKLRRAIGCLRAVLAIELLASSRALALRSPLLGLPRPRPRSCRTLGARGWVLVRTGPLAPELAAAVLLPRGRLVVARLLAPVRPSQLN